MSNAIQKATNNRQMDASRPTMQQYIKQMEGEIKKALPSVITPERFTRIVLSALSTNPKLAETTPQSFLGAMMTAAQLGLEPNTPLGQAYLIPFWNSKNRCSEHELTLHGIELIGGALGVRVALHMGYRKVGWLEQCWYVLKWKLAHLVKGDGKAKQKKG